MLKITKEKKKEIPILVVETATFKDGKTQTTEQEYPSKTLFLKALAKSSLDGKTLYEIKKHNEAFIFFTDARVHFKIIENPKLIVDPDISA